MIPSWIYSLMVENRMRSCSGKDEHGRPIEEPAPDYKESGLAFPGYGDKLNESVAGEKGLAKKIN
jgi:hypothetical protein